MYSAGARLPPRLVAAESSREVGLLRSHRLAHRRIARPGGAESAFEPGADFVAVAEGHVHAIHTKDPDSDLYSLIRVARWTPMDRVELEWMLANSSAAALRLGGR